MKKQRMNHIFSSSMQQLFIVRICFINMLFIMYTSNAARSHNRYAGKEFAARESSLLHKHAPYHQQFVEHHFADHVKANLDKADENNDGILSHDEFVNLVDLVVDEHMEETKGTELHPHPIHIDDVWKDFDQNNDGYIDFDTECHHDYALHSAHQWLQQSEIIAEHERHPHTVEDRVHPKRFEPFEARVLKDLLHSMTDVDRSGHWSEKELVDVLHVLKLYDHGHSKTRLRSTMDMFRRLDWDRSMTLRKKELLKIRHPLDEQFDEFIDQESLRKVVIAFEDRVGYTHNANRFDYLLEHDPEEQKERAEAEANRNEELAEADVVAGSL